MKTLSKRITGTFIALLFGIAMFTACKDDDTVQGTNATDDAFITQAAMANSAEILAGQLAATKGTTDAIRNFGQMMVTDHTNAQNRLKDIGSDLGRSIADTADVLHQALLLFLNSKSGREFDSLYIHSQVLDHAAALILYQGEIDDGENDMVQDYASDLRPAIAAHLTSAQTIAVDY